MRSQEKNKTSKALLSAMKNLTSTNNEYKVYYKIYELCIEANNINGETNTRYEKIELYASGVIEQL